MRRPRHRSFPLATALVVEADRKTGAALSELLGHLHPDVRLGGPVRSVAEGIDRVRTMRPDMLFLGTEIGSMTGFDLLRAIAPQEPHAIFLAADLSHSVQAIRCHALDYLLKPIVPKELDGAVRRALAAMAANRRLSDMRVLAGSLICDNQIALPVNEGLAMLHLDDILYCTSDDNYTEVYVRGEKKPQVVGRTLTNFQKLLSPQDFVRIHQSHLVNRRHIMRYLKGEGGEVVMNDGRVLPVSRRLKSSLMQLLKMP